MSPRVRTDSVYGRVSPCEHLDVRETRVYEKEILVLGVVTDVCLGRPFVSVGPHSPPLVNVGRGLPVNGGHLTATFILEHTGCRRLLKCGPTVPSVGPVLIRVIRDHTSQSPTPECWCCRSVLRRVHPGDLLSLIPSQGTTPPTPGFLAMWRARKRQGGSMSV